MVTQSVTNKLGAALGAFAPGAGGDVSSRVQHAAIEDGNDEDDGGDAAVPRVRLSFDGGSRREQSGDSSVGLGLAGAISAEDSRWGSDSPPLNPHAEHGLGAAQSDAADLAVLARAEGSDSPPLALALGEEEGEGFAMPGGDGMKGLVRDHFAGSPGPIDDPEPES